MLANLDAILKATNASVNDLLKVSVFITDLNDWPIFNVLYAKFLGDHKPARTVIPVKELHYGYKLELDAIAKLKTHQDDLLK